MTSHTSTSPLPISQPQSPLPIPARLATSQLASPTISAGQASGSFVPADNQYASDITSSQRPSFQPFFTLVSDLATSTTYHPRQIHYIFEDDDPELLTAACLDALEQPSLPHESASSSIKSATSSVDKGRALKQQKGKQPPRKASGAAPENRVLLLDVDATGTTVVKAQSLTPNWQILSTNLTPAPTWDAPNASQTDDTTGDGGMMLRIEGTDGGQVSGSRETDRQGLGIGLGQDGGVGDEEFHALMVDFDERMRVLRTVVEAGGGPTGQSMGPAMQDAEIRVDGPRE